MLLLRDCSGSVHLLLRNAVGGYKEFNYVGMGRVACFGLGTRFIKPDEINTSTFSIRMSFIIFVRTSFVRCRQNALPAFNLPSLSWVLNPY